ncbi:hypothetical protein WR25_03504 isoform A [Diploscapter pachys]|uniref:ELM2 domain-containing protein n=1 Tax=Diploscapter pachys TaxID=2018661 RepID=A0A2A2KES9_9BILA|nr:hypothetical protein WR25_03504 isoform A [Diploscapter pachys]
MLPCTSSTPTTTGSKQPSGPPLPLPLRSTTTSSPHRIPPISGISKLSPTQLATDRNAPVNYGTVNGGPNGTKQVEDITKGRDSTSESVKLNGKRNASVQPEKCLTNGSANSQNLRPNGIQRNSPQNSKQPQNPGSSMANQVKTEEPDIKQNRNGNNPQESSGAGQEGTSTSNPVDKIVGTSEPSVSEKVELWMRQESYTAGISQAYEEKQPTASTLTAQQPPEAGKKRRTVTKRAPPTEETASGPPRKSNRKTRAGEEEIVDNYVGSQILASRRTVNPPIGGIRQPFLYPSSSTKEKDRLRIDMVGPKTRSNILEIPVEDSSKKEKGYIKEEKLPALQSLSAAADDEDRDELVWRKGDGVDWNEVNKTWYAVQRQSRGQIPLDAMLHRFMMCGYNVKRLLKNVETERWENLPQPFERFNTMQQLEFERMIRKENGKFREGEKHFRYMHEKFLRKYYQGELVNYYYSTKKKRCFHQVFQRCQCREESCNFPSSSVARYECAICTEYLWPNSPVTELCDVCKLYYRMTKKYREKPARLIENDEAVVLKWKSMAETSGTVPGIDEVLAQIEADRVDNSMSKKQIYEECSNIIGRYQKDGSVPSKHLLKKYEVKATPRCSLLRPWGHDARLYKTKQYTEDEKMAFVTAFKHCNLDKKEVVKLMNKSEEEVDVFLTRFGQILNLNKKEDGTTSNEDDSRPTTPVDDKRVPQMKEGKGKTSYEAMPSTNKRRISMQT